MNKKELVENVAREVEITRVDAEKVLDAVLDAITETLVAGEKVSLVGFGTFETKYRAAREGRNPQTGETLQIPATVAPVFKPGKTLKERVKSQL